MTDVQMIVYPNIVTLGQIFSMMDIVRKEGLDVASERELFILKLMFRSYPRVVLTEVRSRVLDSVRSKMITEGLIGENDYAEIRTEQRIEEPGVVHG